VILRRLPRERRASLQGFVAKLRKSRAEQRALRLIARSDLGVRDPIWTTAYVTRNHGYMIFDTLFALDSKLEPRRQMVADYSVSPDQLSYRLTLRSGLRFHDGSAVRGADCTASLRRWMARDGLGQTLAGAIGEMTADDRSLTIRLREPFPLLLMALAKVGPPVPFMMPERLARTDPYQQINEAVGSGPFKFVAEEFQPGHKVAYVKNPDYLPRGEPPDWASGGKIVKVDRVEWLYVPDHAAAAARKPPRLLSAAGLGSRRNPRKARRLLPFPAPHPPPRRTRREPLYRFRPRAGRTAHAFRSSPREDRHCWRRGVIGRTNRSRLCRFTYWTDAIPSRELEGSNTPTGSFAAPSVAAERIQEHRPAQ